MALIKCKECGKEISDQASTCIKCGAPVDNLINRIKQMYPTKCKECGKEISEQATTCPHCGFKIKEKNKEIYGTGIIISILVILFISIPWIICDSKPENKEVKESTPIVEKKKEPYKIPAEIASKQKERWELIEKFQEQNIIYKITKNYTLPHVYVGPLFYDLNIDQKKILMNLILTFYYIENPEANIVVIHDSFNGKQIGTFSPSGLDLK